MARRAAFAAPSTFRSLLQGGSPLTASAKPVRSFRPSYTTLSPNTTPRCSVRTQMTATGPTRSRPAEPVPKPKESPTYKIALLYDSECPLCMKEVNFLERRVDAQGPPPTIKFVDIASPDYSASENAGIDYETAMGRIHGIKPDGTVLIGVPVFRAAYEAVGLGWVYSVTTLPGVGVAVDSIYNLWARFRLQLTGRPPLEEVMKLRREGAGRTCRPNSTDE